MNSRATLRTEEDGPPRRPVEAHAPLPEAMVLIEGGIFRRGSDRHCPEEAPALRVTVDGFLIERAHAADAEFARFGPYEQWPTGEVVGFHYACGFRAGEASQRESAVVENTRRLGPRHDREGYHLTAPDPGMDAYGRHANRLYQRSRHVADQQKNLQPHRPWCRSLLACLEPVPRRQGQRRAGFERR